MGLKLSKHLTTAKSSTANQQNTSQMAEAPDLPSSSSSSSSSASSSSSSSSTSSVDQCQCASNQPSAKSLCPFCQPSTSSAGQNGDSCTTIGGGMEAAGRRSDIGPRRTFRNLSLGCRKSKNKDKQLEKSGKSKMSWTLRWRLKSPHTNEGAREPMIDLTRFNPNDYPIEDKDEMARRERAREIAEGIEMEIESLPTRYRMARETGNQRDACTEEVVEAQIEIGADALALPLNQTDDSTTASGSLPPTSNAALLEGLTVLLHRSLAISIDSQRAWNVLTQENLRFLAQHFHWHQHQHGPQVFN